MIIVGDIGNTETKICLVNSKNEIIKRVSLNTKKISLDLGFNMPTVKDTINLMKAQYDKNSDLLN